MRKKSFIETKDGITIVRLLKRVDGNDVRLIFDEMMKHNPSRFTLWNFEHGWEISPAQIQKLATYTRLNSKSTPQISLAVVTTEDLSYGLTRMFKAYREGSDYNQQNFQSESEAIAWLKELKEMASEKTDHPD